ncbi:PKD domain-containing protein [Flavitalea sp.]|nr:PKD domain-containing protein [Flavitalea sp.]
MKKLILITCLTILWMQNILARHIKGGEISYEYQGAGSNPNTDRYIITLRLFLECNASGQQLDEMANIGIFRISDNQSIAGSPFNFPLVGDEFINIRQPNPCIVNPSPVCYRLRTYVGSVDLPRDPNGYTAVFQRCCRIENLSNLSPNNNIGSSYTSNIHGIDAILPGEHNSSPSFAVKDTVLICQNRPFELDFGAVDPDRDSLSYEFIDAFNAPGGGGGGVLNPVPPGSIQFVNYASGFSGKEPLGKGVTINPVTGLIAGVAPRGGDYVMSVLVREWRHGKMISDHRKDFNIKVDERCDLAAALLKPTYSSCEDFTFDFRNEAPSSSLIHTYTWEFGDKTGAGSTLASPAFTYGDTGVFNIKLVINKNEQCSDSATAKLFVFPGFSPGFSLTGSCYQNPFIFTDTTRAKYGSVNSWSWDFGDESVANDTNNIPIASWKYAVAGFKQVVFNVTTDKGCEANVTKVIEVRDKPLVDLNFRDTLICSIDSLQLGARGGGIFTWSPGYNIINAGLINPIVYPKTTTWYYVHLNDNGCVNTDSVRVRVVDEVTLYATPDSTICLTDPAQLNAYGDGLKFSWTQAPTLNNPLIRNPIAKPIGNTLYTVTASIGKCSKTEDINISTVPYPFANAGKDTTVCFDDTAQIHASMTGNRFVWTPANTLGNSTNLDPIAFPRRSTVYTLTVFDNIGCPKPGVDDILVSVKDKINAFAGNDTSIVIGQPLQLTGSGSDLYEWTPSIYLNRSNISAPVVHLNDNMTYIMRAFTEEGCSALDTINIKVFKSGPDIFVPNAFTPTGRNRIFRPIPVGIKQLKYFRVFNRYGQLVYETSEVGKGWDGMLGGKLQQSGTFVWMVSGIDYTGKAMQKRGTAMLIR